MNLNWMAIVVALIVTIVIAIFSGIYFPTNVSLIICTSNAPIIGGLIAGYMAGGSYTNGIVNGGISAGVAGLISIPAFALLSGNKLITAMSSTVPATNGTFTIILVIVVAIILFFIIGLIGGIIGVTLKKGSSS